MDDLFLFPIFDYPLMYPMNAYTYSSCGNNQNYQKAFMIVQSENKDLRHELKKRYKEIEEYKKKIAKLESKLEQAEHYKKHHSSHHNNNIDLKVKSQENNQALNHPEQSIQRQPQIIIFDEVFINEIINDYRHQQEEDPVREVEVHLLNELYPNVDNMNYEQLIGLGERMGSVPKGLSNQQIEKLPKDYYSHKKYPSSDDCVICLDKYKEKELIRKFMICNHIFHQKCIDQWLITEKTCPTCKKLISM